jgi:hypothetical protein
MHKPVMLLGAAAMLALGLATPAAAVTKADCEIRYSVCAQPAIARSPRYSRSAAKFAGRTNIAA